MEFLSYNGLLYFCQKIKALLAGKVDKIDGKGLSTNDYTTAEKNKLAGVADGANKYSLPTATSSVLGGVKTGANITNNSGVLSVTAANVKDALGYTPPEQDTNTWRPVVNNLTSDSTTDSLSAAQGKALKALVDGKAPSGHIHDDRYYTEAEIDGKLSGKANSSHTHTKAQVGLGNVDNTADSAKSVKAATKLQTYKQGSTTETYGDSYPIYAQWYGQDVFLKCDNYAVWTDRASVSNSANAVAWGNVTGKPSTFTPSSHIHGVIKNLSVSGTTITYIKDDNTTGTITTQDTNTTYGTFKGATTSEAGSTGLVIAPVAGNANRYLRSDGTWAVPPDTNTTYGVFAKATADAAGSTGLVPAPAKGQQTYYLRGDGTWAVPANTWRGIQDNLTSGSTTDSLSANQGKVLKGLIDGKAASGHTHNYAGSSSAGGAATSANKVNAALTINLNGTSQGAWDGSSAKSISITAASVGATSVTISRW